MNARENTTGAHAERYPPLEQLRASARKLSQDEFVVEHSRPALILLAVDPEVPEPAPGKGETSAIERSFKRTISTDASGAARVYNGRVAFLVKRPRNPFPQMVSIGRAMNNDIVVILETISKLHGYFLREGTSWSYSDHRSTNGTLVNGVALVPGEKKRLDDGDRIRLGLDLAATFVLPETLWSELRR